MSPLLKKSPVTRARRRSTELKPTDAPLIGTCHVGDEVSDQRFMRAKVAVLQSPHDHLPEGVESGGSSGLRKTEKREQAT